MKVKTYFNDVNCNFVNMALSDISCGLEYIVTPDLRTCLLQALRANYAFIVLPVVLPRYRWSFLPSDEARAGFIRSEILSPLDWSSRIVARVSDYYDLDSGSQIVSRRHEDCLREELSYCRHLGLPTVMLTLHSRNVNNLARNLHTHLESSHHPTLIWVCVPMLYLRTMRADYSDGNDNVKVWDEPWYWWSKLHECTGFDKSIGVVVEISADLPSQDVLERWFGEPIKAVIVPTSLFHSNKKGYPVLPKAHQQLLVSMVEHSAQVILRGARLSSIEHYQQYLHNLWKKRPHVPNDPMLSYSRGWEDFLQTPLQPLTNNLDTHTYSVFEQDPIKYAQYQKAIAQALTDLQEKRKKDCINNDKTADTSTKVQAECGQGDSMLKEDEKAITVMVLGAGRGPLVRATLNAADITNTKVKVVAVEKNPCAVVVLAAQAREVWRDRDVTVTQGDMRQIHLAPQADVIVSELLGSWGDNELSPECLDGAAGLLKSGGISIPKEYSSYVAPISSARLWAAARVASPGNVQQMEKNLETLWVVYMQNKHDIGEVKRVFTFEHPAKGKTNNEGEELSDFRGLPLTDNRRSTTLSWEVTQDNVMHGFGGYFDCTLYKKEMISIVPSSHSPGMISWFPIFIPIKTPLRVQRGDTITATFWRCANPRKVWYEWIVEAGNQVTPLHNRNGCSSEMWL